VTLWRTRLGDETFFVRSGGGWLMTVVEEARQRRLETTPSRLQVVGVERRSDGERYGGGVAAASRGGA
jgi:hypothetical protein